MPFDLIGLSYYPWWHGTLAELRVNVVNAAQRYGRSVMVVETSYPWRAGGWESMVTAPGGMAWPASPQGQAQFLRALLAVAGTSGGPGAGAVWWYPEAILVPGLYIWGGGSLALFDSTGTVLPAASAPRAP